MTEILREPGRVANGLSTITARLTKKNDEYIKSITDGQGVIDEQTGELRSTFDILQDLSKAWGNLTSVEQQELTETVAGKTQRSLFTAIMTNFETAVGATEAALNSEGSAMEENNKRMESLQGKVKQLQSAWQDFARNTINGEAVKAILFLATQIVKFANTDLGRFIIMITAAKVAMVAFNKVLKTDTVISLANAFKKQLISAISAVIISFKAGALGATTFSGVLSALGTTITTIGTALLSNPIFLAAATVGIATTVMSRLNEEAQKARDTAQELSDKYKEEAEKGEELLATYEKLSAKQKLTKLETEQLSEAVNELSKSYGLSKEELNAEGKERDNTIKKIKEEIIQRKKSAALQAQAAIDWKKLGFLGLGGTEKEAFTGFEAVSVDDSLTKRYSLEAATVADLQKKLEEYINTLQDKDNKTKEEEKDLQKLMSIYNQVSNSLTSVSEGYKLAYDNLKEGLPITTEEAAALYQVGDITLKDAAIIKKYNEVVKNNSDLTEEQKDAVWKGIQAELEYSNVLESNTEGTKTLTEEQQNLEKKVTQATTAVQNQSEALDNEQKSFNVLKSAVDEYNESGYLSIDTLQSLLALDDEHLAMLSLENGQLILNTTSIDEMTDALVSQRIEQLQAAAMNDLYNLSIGDTDKLSAGAKQAIENLGKDVSNTKSEMQSAIPTLIEYNKRLKEAANNYGISVENKNETQAIFDYYEDAYKKITSLAKETTRAAGTSGRRHTYTGSSKSKSGSSSKDTYKAEIDTLYKYENALDNAKDAVDRLNDALKATDNFNEREKYLKQLINATKDQIKATNDLRKAQTNQINDYIKQLKKQGFQISYNSKTNQLNINNMERLGKFTGDTAKNLEKMINKIQDLNKDNRTLDGSIRDLNSDIADFNDQIEALPEEKLKKFNELLKEFQQSRLDQIQNQIDDIQHEMENDPRLKALEEQISALEKQSDELGNQKDLEEKLLAIEEAKIKLQNAQKQKTIQVYREGKGFVYEADPDAIKEAADELQQAQDNLNEKIKQDQIDQLNAEKEALEKSYQDRIDALQNFLDEQNYLIDKANREGIQTFEELQKKMAEFGLDNAENLKTATDWLNNYNKSLSDLNKTVGDILSSSTNATDGLIYSSSTQDRISNALSSIMPKIDTNTGLTLSNIKAETKTSDNNTGSIYINSIELPNVKDVDDFIEALKDLPRLASSQSTLRK